MKKHNEKEVDNQIVFGKLGPGKDLPVQEEEEGVIKEAEKEEEKTYGSQVIP